MRRLVRGAGQGVREILRPFRNRVLALARKYGAKRVRVFGSVARGEAGVQSDVDLLVDDLPSASLLDHARLELELGRLLGRSVQVVEESDLPWAIRPQVMAEASAL